MSLRAHLLAFVLGLCLTAAPVCPAWGMTLGVTETLPADPGAVVSGDFNDDANPDIIGNGAGTVFMLLGKGDGSFSAPVTLYAWDASGAPASGAVDFGDLNGDERPDVVAAATNPDRVVVLLGDPAGGFRAPVTYTSGFVRALAVVDLDGDERDDVVTESESGAASMLVTRLSQPDGSLVQADSRVTPRPDGPRSLAVGDFTGEGDADVVVGNCAPGQADTARSLMLFAGSGDGKLAAGKPIAVQPHSLPSVLEPLFYDDDDVLDLAYGGNSQVVIAQSVNGGFTTVGSITLAGVLGDVRSVQAAPDWWGLALSESPGGLWLMLPRAGAGDVVHHFAAQPGLLLSEDFDQDGFDDIADVAGGELAVFLSTPAITPSVVSVDFGAMLTGSSATKSVTVAGAGPQPATVGTLKVSGPDAADFALTSDGCGSKELADAQTCSFSVRFTPSALGARTAQVEIPSNDPAGAQIISLAGTGVDQPADVTPPGDPGPPPGGDPGTGPGGGTPPPTIVTAPVLALRPLARQSLAGVLQHGLAVTLGCTADCTATATLSVSRALARKLRLGGVGIARKQARIRGGGSVRVVMKLSRKARRALARERRVGLTIRVVAQDAAGNHARPLVKVVTLR